MHMIHIAVDVIHVDALGFGVFPDVIEDVVPSGFFQERFAAFGTPYNVYPNVDERHGRLILGVTMDKFGAKAPVGIHCPAPKPRLKPGFSER